MTDPDPTTPPSVLPPDPELAEQELVRRIKHARARTPAPSGPRAIADSEAAAWTDLLTRYQSRVFAVCFRMVGNRDTAADLAQDALVKVIQGIDSFDARSKLSTWVIRVTMNLCLSHLRSQKLRAHPSLDALSTDARSKIEQSSTDRATIGEPGPLQDVQLSEQRRIVSDALAALPADQRAILILRDVQGMDYAHVADILGLAVGTVKSRLFRARLALRTQIESQGGSLYDLGRPRTPRTPTP